MTIRIKNIDKYGFKVRCTTSAVTVNISYSFQRANVHSFLLVAKYGGELESIANKAKESARRKPKRSKGESKLIASEGGQRPPVEVTEQHQETEVALAA